MYYTSDKFWVIAGTDFCWGVLRSLRVRCSSKDIKHILEEKILKNNKWIEVKNKKTKFILNAWLELRRLILISKSHNEVKSRKHWNVQIKDLKDLYLLVDPNGQFWRIFELENEDSFKVVKDMENLKEEMYSINNLKDFFENISYFYHRNYINGTFGKATGLFFIFIMQAMLIYKGYGPMIVPQGDFKDLQLLSTYQNNFYLDIAGLPEIIWKRSEYFYKIIDFWVEKSENYLSYIQNDYIE